MLTETRTEQGVTIIDCNGRLVAGGADEKLREVVDQVISEGKKRVVLNLSAVDWVDSSGIGQLVASVRKADENGCRIKLLRIGDKVRHVLALSRILPLFEIYEDEQQAIEDLASDGTQVSKN